MSNTANTAFLEYHYEEGLAMGMTEEEAEEITGLLTSLSKKENLEILPW